MAYDVGGEEEITFWELARMVREYFPKRDIIIENKQVNERFPYYVPDLTDAYGLGCRVRVTLAEAVERTVQYYRRIYEL
jgi:nucleoside-diphosphate-sugar epimerase